MDSQVTQILGFQSTKIIGDPLYPLQFCVDKGIFSIVVLGFQTLDMPYEGSGEMFKGDSADMCAAADTCKNYQGNYYWG